jgi:tripartite-type tricarboxylate transporter receptor subunit TctC
MMKRLMRALALATIGIAGTLPALAQNAAYPTRPVHLVVPYAPGGATDVLARIVAEAMSAKLGQPVVIDNKPGAGTVLASDIVSKTTPDGYTLLFGTLAHSINATLNRKLPFDPLNDFEFVGKIGQLTFAVMVNPALGANDLRALVALLRANPGKYAFGSAGIGSPMHVGGELMKHLTRTDAPHVPYKGESAALTDLLGGRTAFMLCAVPTCAPRIEDGSMKALAVTSATRSSRLPNVPTTAEAGVPGFETYSWFMITAPKGTPRSIVDRLSAALNAVLQDAAFKNRVAAMGIETDAQSTPEGTRAFVRSEIDKWRPIVQATGASVD